MEKMEKPEKMVKKVKTGWLVPVELKDSFVNFCAEKGNLAQEDCAGSLLVWQYLPAQIREQARLEAKGVHAVGRNFWVQFSHEIEAVSLKITENKAVDVRSLIKTIGVMSEKESENIIKLLSKKESKALSALRDILGPEKPKQKKKKIKLSELQRQKRGG